MSITQCPYKLLGVDRDADANTIKKAYRKLMMKYHEDRVTNQVKSKGLDGTPEGEQMIEDAKNKSASLNVAENILTDTTEYETDSGKKYTKREVYDKYGHDGLELLQNGNDPAQAGVGNARSKHSWEQAVDIFGGRKDPTEDMDIEDILGGTSRPKRKERKVDDILKDAKRADDSRYDSDIDELLDETRNQTRRRRKEKYTNTNTNSKTSIDDITDKLGGFFDKAKKKAEGILTNTGDTNPNNSKSLDKVASDIIEVVGELAASGGNLSKEDLTSIITKLTNIASEIKTTPAPKKGSRFDL